MPLDDFLDIPNAKVAEPEVETGDGLESFMDVAASPPSNIVPPVEPVVEKGSEVDPKKFYGSAAVAAPIQGLSPIPMVWSPAIAAHLGKMGIGPKPEGGWDEFGNPLGKDGKPYRAEEYEELSDKVPVGKVLSDTLKGLGSLATQPMEVVRGVSEFALSIPGFLTGLANASANVARNAVKQMSEKGIPSPGGYDMESGEMKLPLHNFSLLEMYDEAARGMREGMEYFAPAVEQLVGKPTETSQLVGQVAMAPLSTLSFIGQSVANYEGFKDYPNVRGAALFAGDLAGFLSMGMILHGPSARADFSRSVEDVVKKAHDIAKREQAADGIPNEILKQAQKRILEAEKQNIELQAKEIAEKLGGDALVIEEISRQAEELARNKIRPVANSGVKDATQTTIRESFRLSADELAGAETTFTSKKGHLYHKVDGKWYTDKGVEVTNKFVIKAAEKGSKVEAKPVEPEVESVASKPVASPVEPTPLRSKNKQSGEKAPIAITKIYRQGRPEGKWWTPDKEYAESFGKTSSRVVEDKLSPDIKLIDEVELKKLVPDYEKDIDAALDTVGYDGMIRLEETMSGESYTSYYLRNRKAKPVEPKVEPKVEPTKVEEPKPIEPEIVDEGGTVKPESTKKSTIEYTDYKDVKDELSDVFDLLDEPWKKTGDKQMMLKGKRSFMITVKELAEGEQAKVPPTWHDGCYRRTVARMPDGTLREGPAGSYDTILNDKAAAAQEGALPNGATLYVVDKGPGNVRSIKIYRAPLRDAKVKSKGIGENKKLPEPKVIRKRADKVTEVDLDSGLQRGEQLEGENSPFFQDVETSNTFRDIFDKRKKAIEEDVELFTQKLINDVNRWYHGDAEVDIVRTREMLDKLATRGDELRSEFQNGVDHLQWMDNVSEAATWAKGLDRSIKKRSGDGTKLYSGIPIEETIVKGAKAVSDYVKKARGIKSFKPLEALSRSRTEFVRSAIDKSGNIRREMLDKIPAAGYEILQKMYLAKGASSRSAINLKQLRKDVYRGLNHNERRILDTLILAERMIDIGKYKSTNKFNFPEGLEPTKCAAYSELLEFVEKIGPERAALIRDRAAKYYEWMKKPLKDMLDAELISKEEYDALASHNYRKIKLVDAFDKRYVTKIGGKKRTVYDSGIEALARGRNTDIFEPSSEIMALEVFNRAYGRIMNNLANKELLNLARTQPNNPFVRIKESKKDRIPSGWNRIFVYEGGERKAMYISPEMAKEWIINNPEMTYKMSQLLRYASGSPVLKTFATGINWGFALANMPKDIMHTWFAARKFEGGEWKPLYSSTAPVYALQMGRDLAAVAHDAITRKGRYEDYINEGGGMEFLVHQGRLLQRGRHIEKPLDKFFDFAGWLGETSEVMTRLAIRERALRQGKSKTEAAFIARDYMDFGQGGTVAKALDNGIPYLNASIQGTRGLLRAFKDNPVASTYKLAQFGAAVTGLYVAMQAMHPKSSAALKGNVDNENNICIPLGDSFGFEDEEGQIHYPYLKIPLDPGQKFFKVFFEASTDKWLGNEVDVDHVTKMLAELSPAGVSSLPPTISGTLGYFSNKDFWLNEDIWRRTDKPLGWPQSKEEFIPGKTPQAFIDFGAATGLSPERTKYLVEELTTNGTVWSALLGEGYEKAFGDMPKVYKERHLAEVLSKKPIAKRFIGITHPYSSKASGIEKIAEKDMVEKWVQTRELDSKVDGYLFHDTHSRMEVVKYINEFKDPAVRDRLKERFLFAEKTKDLGNRSFWLRLQGLSPRARAEAYVKEYKGANEERRRELMSEVSTVSAAGGVITDDFKKYASKLMFED